LSYIRSADAALYYEEYGGGETLILLPGFLGTIESDWRRFIPDFARHFHVIAVDLRGHGKTDNPSGSLHFDALLDDLHILVDTLEIDRAFLCSHGLLSSLPIAYAVRHPERVQGIILHAPEQISASSDRTPPKFDIADAENLRRLHESANGPDGWANLLMLRRNLFDEIALSSAGGIALSTLELPVLITAGEDEDTEARQAALEMAQLFPRGNFTALAQSKRGMSTVQKQPFIGAVASFARGIAGSQ